MISVWVSILFCWSIPAAYQGSARSPAVKPHMHNKSLNIHKIIIFSSQADQYENFADLQKRVRAILTFLRKKDQHAELLLYVWQLQHLQAVVTDIVEGETFSSGTSFALAGDHSDGRQIYIPVRK